jgi:hypothetical protein
MGKILASHQNLIYNRLFNLIGTTSTGYGSTLVGHRVAVGDVVEPDNWNQLGQDVVRCVIHQYGPAYDTPSTYDLDIGKVLNATTGTLITYEASDRLYTNIQLLTATSSTAHPSQLVTEPIYPEDTSANSWNNHWVSGQWQDISSNRWQEVNRSNGYATSMSFTWFHPMQLNYFFNLGGLLTPSVAISGSIPSEIASWRPLVETLNTVKFGKTEYYETMATTDKIYRRIISRPAIPGVSYAKAIIVKYQIKGSVISLTINFIAGFTKLKTTNKAVRGKWKTGGKGKKQDTVVNLRVRADVYTTYSTGETGGIQAPIPQPQLVGGFLSAPIDPVSPFTFASGFGSDVRTIILRNNSTLTCTISNITLSGAGNGYDVGTVSTTTMVLAPITSSSFTVQYFGDTPGYNRGYIYITSNVNPVVLFTEINIGGVEPNSWITTTTTTALMTQDFVVDHAGGNYRGFDVSIAPVAGFTCIPHIPGDEYDSFRVTFNPVGRSNGIHSTTATVVIHPLDTSLSDTIARIPISITRNVHEEHLGSWISARGYMNEVIGFSYDWIGGRKYLTIGLGVNSTLAQLRTVNSFSTWNEVYRIEITGGAITYHTNGNIIKSQDFFDGNTIGYHFGVGNSLESVCTIKDNGAGNLGIVMNTVRKQTGNTVVEGTLTSLANAAYYYDGTVNRVTQLEALGTYTNFFTGFGANGAVKTKLVKPNLL